MKMIKFGSPVKVQEVYEIKKRKEEQDKVAPITHADERKEDVGGKGSAVVMDTQVVEPSGNN